MPVSLRLLTGTETFTPLGSDQPVSVGAGEYGYVDARDRVLCRLDLLQAEFSKVTRTTKSVLLIVEGAARHPAEHLRQAVNDVMEIVTKHSGGAPEVAAWPE
jgi:DNA/RNA-binding domain of Phe-tRNA-synthetase-like protein